MITSGIYPVLIAIGILLAIAFVKDVKKQQEMNGGREFQPRGHSLDLHEEKPPISETYIYYDTVKIDQ
jgi:hypothetical protein